MPELSGELAAIGEAEPLPEPFYVAALGCGGNGSSGASGFRRCPSRAAWAGLRASSLDRPITVWWAFACDQHRHQLVAARRLVERDHAELARRRDHERAVIEDHAPYIPLQPLAVGLQARALIARALEAASAPPLPDADTR